MAIIRRVTQILCDLRLPLAALRLCVGCLLVASWLLAACSQPEIQPLSVDKAPWHAGEMSIYQITDSNGVAAGTTTYAITAGDTQSNPNGWTIQREIAAQGVNEMLVVQVDQDDFRPRASRLTRSSSRGKEIVKATYTLDGVDIEMTSVLSVTTNQHIAVPSDARVEATVLPLVRALPLATNYATRLNSFSPDSGLLARVTVQVVKAEEVTVPAGTFATWQVELDTGNSKTLAWIGRDAPNPLVKYVDGQNQGTFALSEYKPGQ